METPLIDLVEQLIRQNPDLRRNPRYLLVEVWTKQGLKLYPNQRELLLSGKLSAAEGVARAGRKAREKMKAEKARWIAAVESNRSGDNPGRKPFRVKITQL